MKNIVLLLLVFSVLQGCIIRQYPDSRRGEREVEERQFTGQFEEPLEEPRKRRPRMRQSAWSRVETGTLEVAGDLGLSVSSTEAEAGGTEVSDTDTLQLETSVLYYIAPDVGLGFTFFADNTDISSGGDSVDIKTFAIGPQAGINVGVSDVTNFRLLGSIFLADVDISTSFGTTGKADGFGVSLSGGMSYFIAENISLNGGLSYTRMSLDTKSTNIEVDIDSLNLGIGLSVYMMR